MKTVAVLLAGGKGERLGGECPKQFLQVAEKSCIEHVFETFLQVQEIEEILVVSHSQYLRQTEELLAKYSTEKVVRVIAGGNNRCQSVYQAIRALPERDEIQVFFHDVARLLVSQRIIQDCLAALETHRAACTAVAVTDTILRCQGSTDYITEVPDRNEFLSCQTPQAFHLETIRKAYELALQKDPNLEGFTDDCGLLLCYLPEEKIAVVRGEYSNKKLTRPEDLPVFQYLLKEQSKVQQKDR